MKTRVSIIAVLSVFCATMALAVPATIVISPPPANVIQITGQNPPSITITRPVSDVVTITTPGPQGPRGIDGSIGVDGAPGPTGPQGPAGATGATGPQGPTGDTGSQGPRGYDGYDGSQIFTGTGAPVSGTGTLSDYYLNTFNGDIYLKEGSPAAWTLKGNLKGPSGTNGANGTNGTNGTNGKTVLNGIDAPGNGLGVDGDFYLDTANAHFYGPKTAGAWGTYIDLVGPQGPQGPPGASSSITQTGVLQVLDDATDGSTLWVQQGATEQATDAKMGVKDRLGNAKQWVDSNGTMVRQCITSDTSPAFKMLSSGGAVIYTVSCDNTMTFSGTVTIK